MLSKKNADDSTHGLAQLRRFIQNRGALFQSDGSNDLYLATQAIADFLATEASVPIDGIIFPS
jgi:hypothetical protein